MSEDTEPEDALLPQIANLDAVMRAVFGEHTVKTSEASRKRVLDAMKRALEEGEEDERD